MTRRERLVARRSVSRRRFGASSALVLLVGVVAAIGLPLAARAASTPNATLYACMNGNQPRGSNYQRVNVVPVCPKGDGLASWPVTYSPSATATTTTASATSTTKPVTTTTRPASTTTTTTAPAGGQVCTTTLNGDGSNLGAYHDPNISNSNGFNTYDSNNVWNPQPGTTAKVCGPSNTNGPATPMSVTTSTGNFGGEVISYPNVQQETNNFVDGSSDFPLDSSTKILSTYNETNPALASTGEWESAYDLWNDGHYNEIMIWTCTSSALVTDSYGGATEEIAHVTIGGIDYSYWEYGDGLPILANNTCAASGTVDVRAALMWMKTVNIHGGTPTAADPAIVTAGESFGQMDYGWEVRGLNGATETFKMNSYSLTLS